MPARHLDTLSIKSARGVFDRFNSVSIVNDLLMPAEAAFEVGDDSTWSELHELENIVGLGQPFKVFLNDRLRLTGRVELNDLPIDATTGAVTRFTVRTKLADAMYASADPAVRVKSSSIKDFVLYLWSPLGLTEADFVFNGDVSRDLMTGISSDGTKPTVDLEELAEEQAKVNPPETIYQATDRHLRRHGLMIWDSPDGKLVIGAPDDEQTPLYYFQLYNDARGNANNLLSATKTQDASGVPGLVYVAGTGGKSEWTKAKVRGFAEQPVIASAGFYRPVLIVNEGAKTDAIAQRQAAREMTIRSQRLDSWILRMDGLSYWDGYEKVPFGIDTVCNITCTAAGGPNGAYLVLRTQMNRSALDGDSTELTVIKRGLWRL